MKRRRVAINSIIEFLGKEVIVTYGNYDNVFIDNITGIENVNDLSLDWVKSSNVNKQNFVEKSRARVILVDSEIIYSASLEKAKKILIVVKDTRKILSKIINEFWIDKKIPFIHERTVIDPESKIEESSCIEAGCVIGKATIGKNTIIKANVTIYDDVFIGDNCIIQSGAVIGTDGLGCDREEDGTLVKFPHIGKVVIGNNVEIGANCQIAKGSLSDTIISDGCKINGLCFIAHNCFLDKNVWITGSTMLAGSVSVGENTTIFSKAIIREQCRIGEGVTIGMGSVVTKDVPDYETWVGSPAKKI